jgi:hypothetical protein
MDSKQSEDQYSPSETKRRMEDALRRALNTPPKPHSEMVGKRRTPKTQSAKKRR